MYEDDIKLIDEWFDKHSIGLPYADEEANTGFSAESETEYMLDCVAWMPLPEPYTE